MDARGRRWTPGAKMSVVAVSAAVLGALAVPAGAVPVTKPDPTPAPATRPTPPQVPSRGAVTPTAWESVTLGMTPADPVAIARLAKQQHLNSTTRRAALDSALASTAQVSSVETWLRSRGLTVTASSRVAVTAAGPADVVSSIFGSGKAMHRPTGLGSSVSYVVGSSDPGQRRHSHRVQRTATAAAQTVIDGPTARRIYGVPERAATTDSKFLTIATIQFSGWDASELTTFANAAGLPDPVASRYYQEVSVDGANPRTIAGDGDGEVALDQETILDTAPQVVQVAYFAPNTDQGEIDAYNAMISDAQAGTGLNFTALSNSWGQCERYMSQNVITAQDQALQTLAAAGITHFVASGDNGAFDCSDPDVPDNHRSVDSPSGSPHVVAVGGLTTTSFATPSERSWWDTSYANAAGFRGIGSGGGVSVYRAQPSWQASRGAALGVTSGRLVPDIALDADPDTGAWIYNRGEWSVSGGTSLAAPLAAATLADEQIVRDPVGTAGLGNIGPSLYGAPASSFRDTVLGTNGYFATRTGYDLATGLGAPLWSRLADALMGYPIISVPRYSNSTTISATVSAPTGMIYYGWRGGVGTNTEPANCGDTPFVNPPSSYTVGGDGDWTLWAVGYAPNGHCFLSEAVVTIEREAPTVTAVSAVPTFGTGRLTWKIAGADTGGSGIGRYAVRVTRTDTGAAVFSGSVTRSTLVTAALPGVTYQARVIPVDRAGNIGVARYGRSTFPYGAYQLKYSTGWTRKADLAAPGHVQYVSSTRGATATLRVTASRIYVYGLRQRAGGQAYVYVDGRLAATINLYSATTRPLGGFLVGTFPAVGVHTVVVRVAGRHTAGATGNVVALEAVLVAR